MAVELASAYISLIPELKGAGKSIASQLSGVDVTGSGRRLGRQLSEGLSRGISTEGLKGLEDAVATAQRNVGKAMEEERVSAEQLRIAQQRLAEVQQRYAAGSSQVLSAQARVSAAERKHETASVALRSAQQRLKDAQDGANVAMRSGGGAAKVAAAGLGVLKTAAGGAKAGLSKLRGGLANIGTAAVRAGQAVSLAFAAMVPGAVAAADATEKFKGTLKFAGFDASEIDALAKATKEYADRTVYDLADIQGMTAQLASNGVKDFDRLAEAAGNLNAAAGGNADTFRSFGMVMTQTNGLGKLTTENWNQLTEAVAGVSMPLKQALLDMGAYEGGIGDFNKAMENGEISAEEFNAAVMQLGFEEAALEAATSAETFEGMFGVLTASATSFITEGLGRVKPFVKDVTEAAAGFIDGAWSKIDAFTGAVSQKWGEFIDALKANGAYDQIAAAFDAVSGAVGAVGDAIGDSVGKFVEWATSSETVQGAADLIKGVIDAAKGAVDGIVQAFKDWTPVLAGVCGGLAAFAAYMGITALIETVKGAIIAMRNANLLAAAAQAALNLAMNLNPMMLIVTAIGVLVGALVALWTTNEDFRNAVMTAWEAIKGAAETVWGAVCGFFTETVPNAISTMVSFFAELPGNIASFFSSIIDSAANWAASMVNRAVQTGSEFLSNIGSFFSQLPGNVASFLSGVISNVAGWVAEMGSNALSAASEFGSNLLDGLTSLPGKLVDVGWNLITGLKDGILSGVQGVIDAVGGAVDDAISFAKNLLGIHSPSRVFMGIGDYTMQGFADGIERSASAAAKAMDDAIGSVISDASMGFGMDARVSASAFKPVPATAAAGNTFGDVYVTIDGGRPEDVFDQLMRGIERAKRQYAGRW